ncbi:MAG TPA: 4,5-dihydroxyphthalate decarboxylase [Casimicrobiaceae bacterium]|nr:4,5-dihydroxyphthalate decarboxylase [Casimicrobiaceae bacterium]
MSNLTLSLAIGEYDHVRDLLDESVRIAGVDLTVLRLPIEEIFYRSTFHREFDVCEMSFAKIVALASQGDSPFVPLPVFPSRVFRHSSIYVRTDGGLDDPRQLLGKRVGVPEWAQTAAVYTRGMLAHDYAVDLGSIRWFQAGVNAPGRREKVALKLPKGVELTVVPDQSLSQMLVDNQLDAVLSARPPAPFLAGDSRIRRLFADARSVEQEYARRTGIFPIMHVVALRRDHYERAHWLAMNLVTAFEEAKRRSLARLDDRTASFYPIPWVGDSLHAMRALFGDDPWPYGIEANRVTLDAFLRYAFEQGVAHRRLTIEALFPAEVASRYVV